MSLSVAIIGAGPSGFYAAEALLKSNLLCKIDFIDRLPTPFGLVRAGVAPDHQGTKNVINLYQKTLENPAIAYFGNVELGRDIFLDEVKKIYDLVILATGAFKDRRLNIAGAQYDGVYGAGEFVGWYNAHPDFSQKSPNLISKNIVIIGHGNVALDIARILAKSPAELLETDIAEDARLAIQQSPVENIYLIGHRAAHQARFTPAELRELGKLRHATPRLDPASLPEATILADLPRMQARNMQILQTYATAKDARNDAKNIHLIFESSAKKITTAKGRATAITFAKNQQSDGKLVCLPENFTIQTSCIITAIGFVAPKIDTVPFDEKARHIRNEMGWVEDNIWVVGWGKRGASGTLPSNRAEAFQVVKLALERQSGKARQGRQGFIDLLAKRSINATNLADWQVIDQHEIAQATPPAPRQKIPTIDKMLRRLTAAKSI